MMRWCGSEHFGLILPTASERFTVVLYTPNLALRYLVW